MKHDYWQKQTDKPLFPELEWDKPERRDQAGRLLIVGGYLHNLTAPAKAYQYVKEQGIGDVKVALPNKTKSLLGKTLPAAVYLPSTTSGELAREGFEEIIDYANWADTILIPGDLGRNSQTTLLISDLVQNTTNQIVLTKDAVDILQNSPELIFQRENTTLVLSFAQLQSLAKRLNWPEAFTFSMGLIKMVENLHRFTTEYPCNIMTLHQNNLVVASSGKISTTSLSRHPELVSGSNDGEKKILKQVQDDKLHWRTKTASIAACYQTWNPNKPFQALTHSASLMKEQNEK
jgi:NAD(P)H-hydrate repair Nnr-like enzyme with NAD(P)H-hydrate dehydratase domain